MKRDDINKRRVQLTEQLAELDDTDALFAAHPEYRVAELIHDATCHANHSDDCFWLYESWSKIGSTRNAYLLRAQKLIDAVGETGHSLSAVFAVLEAL